MYYLHVVLDGLPRGLNSGRMSTNQWVLRRIKHQWQLRVIEACQEKGLPPAPLPLARVKFTRCSSVRPDFDNLVGSFKGCLDALVKAKVLVNDHFQNIGWPEYDWMRAPAGQGAVVIEVWEQRPAA